LIRNEEKMLKIVGSFKPGVYVRRQVVYQGAWVDIKGFLILPVGRGARKWMGLAIAKNRHDRIPATKFIRHNQDGTISKVGYMPQRSEQ